MNSLTTVAALIHKTTAPLADMRVNAKPECSNRKIAGWVTIEKAEAKEWEKFCPKCYK